MHAGITKAHGPTGGNRPCCFHKVIRVSGLCIYNKLLSPEHVKTPSTQKTGLLVHKLLRQGWLSSFSVSKHFQKTDV